MLGKGAILGAAAGLGVEVIARYSDRPQDSARKVLSGVVVGLALAAINHLYGKETAFGTFAGVVWSIGSGKIDNVSNKQAIVIAGCWALIGATLGHISTRVRMV